MKEIKKIGVVGAGNMGSGIAQKLAMENLTVTLVDTTDESVKHGLATIEKLLEKATQRKVLSPEKASAAMGRIKDVTNLEALADADLVIEAIPEDEQAKKQLFKDLDNICDQKTIFATTTSSFLVADLAGATNRPDRFVGMHYFPHPAINQLLEIVSYQGASEETIHYVLEVSRLHGKTTLLVKDAPGFCVNRFLFPLLAEALKIKDDGIADIPTIEEAARQAFKTKKGPFEIMNARGIATVMFTSEMLGRELGAFYAPPQSLSEQVESGQPFDLGGDVDESKLENAQERLYGACLGAAAALVSQGVASMEDTDRGAKLGLNWRLGPFEIMNRIGIDRTFQLVEAMTKKYSGFNMPEILAQQCKLGNRFKFNYVDLETRDGIAFITINRPEALNALNEITVAQIDEKFTKAEQDSDVKAIVLRGAGKAFVAGADIRYFINNIKKDKIEDTAAFTTKGHDLFLRIENSDKITVAVLDGLSMGGGSELALSCQAIIGTPAASLGFPETAIGIFPGLGGMIRSARQMGTELAKYYVLTGKTITAQDAYELGIITELVPTDELQQAIINVCSNGKPDKYRAREIPERFADFTKLCSDENIKAMLSGEKPNGVSDTLAEKTLKIISRKAPLALKKANELIDAQQKVTIPEAIKLELNELFYIFSTQDALAGLTSVGKKPPHYLGK